MDKGMILLRLPLEMFVVVITASCQREDNKMPDINISNNWGNCMDLGFPIKAQSSIQGQLYSK